MSKNLFKLIRSNSSKFPRNAEEVDLQALLRCSTAEARSLLPQEIAIKLSVLPLALIELPGKSLLTLAAYEPSLDLERSLSFTCGLRVKLIKLKHEILKKAVLLAYQGDERSLSHTIERLSKLNRPVVREQLPLTPGCEVNEFLKTLLHYSVAKRVTDIHLIPGSDGLNLKLRIDGELRSHEKPVCSNEVYKRVVSRIKTLAGLDPTQHETTQDGSITMPLGDGEIAVRVGIMPTIHGEKIVLRLHGVKKLIPFNELGLNGSSYEFLHRALSGESGIIIAAGATGSGKSTTLYAMLKQLSIQNKSIVSVEDPVEIRLENIAQTGINLKKGLGYPEALKAALRQDPDCIMIGELRDPESARIGFDAALTGHLVLSSLHAGSVSEALGRLSSLGIPDKLISQACRAIIHQRLLPRLCESCKVFDLDGSNYTGDMTYKPVGCKSCDYTGYNGRSIIAETLYFDDKIKMGLGELPLEKLLDPQNYCPSEPEILHLVRCGELEARYIQSAVKSPSSEL